MEPETIGRTSHIYNYYMGTPIGQALEKVLSEMQDGKIIDEDTKYIIEREFRKSITEKMDEFSGQEYGPSCQIEGEPIDFRFIYNIYYIKLKPGIVHLETGTLKIPCLEVTAMRHDD